MNAHKWNESGFRPPSCTFRLNWARRTSWGWWDDWDDTVLQTQDSKFEPWRSKAEHATSRSRRLPTILTFTRGWGRNIFCFLQTAETGNRTPDSGVKGSGANHYPRAPALVNAQQKNFCRSSLWTCLHHMVILRSQNKITDSFTILACACPFKLELCGSHFCYVMDAKLDVMLNTMSKNISKNITMSGMLLKKKYTPKC